MSLWGTGQLQKLIDTRYPIMEDLVNKLHQDTRPICSNYALQSIAATLIRDYYLLYDSNQLCEDLRGLYTCCSLAKNTEEDYTFLFQAAGEIAIKLIDSAADFQIHPRKAKLLEYESLYTNLCFCFAGELLESYFSLAERRPSRELRALRRKNRLAILSVIAPSCPELDPEKPRGLLGFFKSL